MRRLWIAAGLLALLLCASLANGWHARQLTDSMRQRLGQAQVWAEREEWSQAQELTRQVYDDWERNHFYFHATMRHSDTDQILRSFREVMEYLKLQEPDQYNAANADLMAQLELLAEMEQASAANVL